MKSFLVALVFLFFIALPAQAGYDPLVADASQVETVDLTVHDKARNRDIPLRVYLPAERGPHPVILFSHGLGGSRGNSPYLGTHWAGRGYAAVFMQHAGSDEAVWRDKGRLAAIRAMGAAANSENLLLRFGDVPAVIDQLTVWNRTAGNRLAGQLDLTRLGMSGHSFGAVTTQGVSGQVYQGGKSAVDPRLRAAFAMSPSPPKQGDAAAAFADVQIPWLLMTGTEDSSPIARLEAAERLKVYPALPPGGKYELVLFGAKHSAFGDSARGDKGRDPNHHRVIQAVSTAFWDAYLKGDAAAKAWLNGEGPRTLLAAKDQWRHK